MIKSGGEWISSVDLENELMAHPAVQEAAVIGIPDERWGERPLACVVLRAGAKADAAELAEFLGEQGGALAGAGELGVRAPRSRRPRSASSTRRCSAPGTPRASWRSSGSTGNRVSR